MFPFTVFYIYPDTEGSSEETVWADSEEGAKIIFSMRNPLAEICEVTR